ncbi:NAD(P)-dependent alcohol dehydrogenase [Micromonospora sp. CPCC 206061]|uniref:NAD(P)-dependent alcohol dehydrogenase n=1 Tax=Micromonospora sp. CPCC 206061 TaxID=3122410 RepID=UPI002FF207D7
MRAAMFHAYGPPEVLTQVELPTPVPRADQLLIRVHATTVTSAECGMRRGEPMWGRVLIGLRRPRKGVRVLGLEFAGEVAAVGPAARQFRAGDRVFGFTGFGAGANAEYKCLSERASVTMMPANVTYAQAAATVDGFTTAWYFLRDLADVQAGQKVLIIGASGSIGTYAVQLAKQLGAVVHGVCSGRNVKLIESLGTDRVFDYTVEDFTASGERYDAVFDTVGRSSFARCRPVLAPRGCYLPTTGLVNTALAVRTAVTGGPRVRTGMSVRKHVALATLREQLSQDRLRIVIDRSYPMAEIVEAHRHVDSGHKTGNVVITVVDG